MYSEFLAIGQKRKQGNNQYRIFVKRKRFKCSRPVYTLTILTIFVSEDEKANCMRWQFINVHFPQLQLNASRSKRSNDPRYHNSWGWGGALRTQPPVSTPFTSNQKWHKSNKLV